MSANLEERPHLIRAQLHALLGAGATTDRLDALHRDAQRMLGAAHEATLTVEYHLRALCEPALPAGKPWLRPPTCGIASGSRCPRTTPPTGRSPPTWSVA